MCLRRSSSLISFIYPDRRYGAAKSAVNYRTEMAVVPWRHVAQLPKSARYAQILKNSVALKEIANERIFLMKDLAAVEEAVDLGAKIYEGENSF
jgi:hypothetical protein